VFFRFHDVHDVSHSSLSAFEHQLVQDLGTRVEANTSKLRLLLVARTHEDTVPLTRVGTSTVSYSSTVLRVVVIATQASSWHVSLAAYMQKRKAKGCLNYDLHVLGVSYSLLV
jgi:hypothetical protein